MTKCKNIVQVQVIAFKLILFRSQTSQQKIFHASFLESITEKG